MQPKYPVGIEGLETVGLPQAWRKMDHPTPEAAAIEPRLSAGVEAFTRHFPDALFAVDRATLEVIQASQVAIDQLGLDPVTCRRRLTDWWRSRFRRWWNPGGRSR